ncbi:peptidase M4 [Duganella sp. Leaf126]|nr:peptidase M4 [Duganella sp. Leaf126]
MGKQRGVYDAGQLGRLPGTLLRAEGGQAVPDQQANQAYDGAGITYDFLRAVFNRDSIDGRGRRLDSTIHYQQHFNNAFWNGDQMVYGDGDGKSFIGFTRCIDVIAHELTHGLIQYAVPGGLDYEGQSGALNESIADVFGSVVKQWSLGQSVGEADWLIGHGIMGPGVGKALRSLADPGNRELTWSGDDQPKTLAAYVADGAVHTNSGIPNHAFYALCMALGGHAWDRAAPIWYHALALLTPTATFADMARATGRSAARLYGAGSSVQRAVQSAWQLVGVNELEGR